MPDIGGPRQKRRPLVASLATCVLTYTIPVWSQASEIKAYRKIAAAVHLRSALRIACGYRTVSDVTACVIAGMIPIEVLVKERQALYRHRGTIPPQLGELRTQE